MEVMVLIVLALVLLVHFWPQKPSGYIVPAQRVADFALKMETRIGRLEQLVSQGKLAPEVIEACIEVVKETNDFVLDVVGRGNETT
jgi:hypothetical protein